MGLLSDKVALKREFEKAGLRYDQDTMKAIEALKANPERTDDLISKIQEINISQFDLNKDGVFDKKELEKMIVTMVTKGIVEGIQEFGTIEAFPKPKEFFAIREAKDGELVETYVKDGTLETSRVAKAGEYVIFIQPDRRQGRRGRRRCSPEPFPSLRPRRRCAEWARCRRSGR